MKALQVSRSVPKIGMARIASALSPITATKLGPLELRRGRRARTARPRLAACPHPARRHLRLRPLARRGARLAVLRRLGVVPVHPRPRGGRRTRRRHPGDPRTGARPRGARLRSPVRRCRPGRRRRLRPPRDRPPRAGDPDRVLLLDRRRLGADVRRPRLPTARRSPTTCPTSGPCSSSRSPAASTPRCCARRRSPPARTRRCNRSSPCSAPGTMGLAAIAGLRRYLPDVRIIVGARYPHQRVLAKQLGADSSSRRPSCPVRSAVPPAATWSATTSAPAPTSRSTPSATAPASTDCLRITRPRGRVVLLGMPADVTLDLTGLWHRETELKGAYTYGTETLPDGTHAAARSTSPSRPPTSSRPNACCRPPTRSSTTSTPSPTPPPPAAAAP